jgi:hypothetical protein
VSPVSVAGYMEITWPGLDGVDAYGVHAGVAFRHVILSPVSLPARLWWVSIAGTKLVVQSTDLAGVAANGSVAITAW